MCTPKDQIAERTVVMTIGSHLTGNFELMLIKVCDEVSMRLSFLLTAAIATRQERLPSLLVWYKYMQG